MAVKKTENETVETAVRPDPRETVTVRLPFIKGKKGEFVSVNNHRYFVPRGVDVEVPRFIAEVLETSEKQDQRTAEMIEQLVTRNEV